MYRSAIEFLRLELAVATIEMMPPGAEREKRLRKWTLQYAGMREGSVENHEAIDYDTFRAEHVEEFGLQWPERAWIWIRREAVTVGPYLCVIALPPALVYLLASRM
jgi:hypothetical protein